MSSISQVVFLVMGSEGSTQQFLEKGRNLYCPGLESCWTLIARKLLGSCQEVEEMSLVSPLQNLTVGKVEKNTGLEIKADLG